MRVRNPQQDYEAQPDDDDEFLSNVPQRISSSKSSNKYSQARSSLEMNVDIPSNLSPEEQFNTARAWPDDDFSQKGLLESVNEELIQRHSFERNLLPKTGETLPLNPPLPEPPKPSQIEESSENTYNLPDDVEDEGPDLDSLIDRMLTLTPDTHPPKEFPDDRPPALPPKMSRKQNGVVPHSKEVNDVRPAYSAATPPEVPPRREKSETNNNTLRPVSYGLPPTPKVHMGACFSKVFNGCPLKIKCTAGWINPDTRDEHILIGANEGLYTLNLNEIHEASLELLHARQCTWLYVINNILMSISGKNPHLYRHDLMMLHSKQSNKFSLPVKSKIPERFVPRKYTATSKVPDTKGCVRCCVGRNPYNGYKYLCGSLPTGVILMQWYEPLNKFMQLKIYECDTLPTSPKVFEMFISPELEYPLICLGVRTGTDKNPLVFDVVNLNSASNWFTDIEMQQGEQLAVVNVTQVEKDTVLICHDKFVKAVSMSGKMKSNRRQASELHFDFTVESLVCLQDSVLAFHKHGMQGRSIKTNEVTQEICDKTRIFHLLGSDRVICLESRPTDQSEAASNLYLLAGHENTY